jgi:hypothetical protein
MLARTGKRIAAFTFLFFLIKGLVWLALGGLVAWAGMDSLVGGPRHCPPAVEGLR